MWTFRNFCFLQIFRLLCPDVWKFQLLEQYPLGTMKSPPPSSTVGSICRVSKVFRSNNSVIPDRCLKLKKMNGIDLKSMNKFLLSPANNHHGRSQGDCIMIISVFDQIANMAPASIFVFGNRSWAVGTSSCKAAYYVNTFISFGRCIQIYSEKYLLLTEVGGPWNPKVIDSPPPPFTIHYTYWGVGVSGAYG